MAHQQPLVGAYPSPTAGPACLVLAAAASRQVQVLDLAGRLVHTARFTSNSYSLATSCPLAGTYFVRVQSGASATVQRPAVER